MGKQSMAESKGFKAVVELIMNQSDRQYTSEKKMYRELPENEREKFIYLNAECKKIFYWINLIFGRFEFENAKELSMKDITFPPLDEYGNNDYVKVQETAIDDLNKIVRLHIYIAECFFRDRNKYFKPDYLKIFELFEKICIDFDWDFYARHQAIEDLYASIDANQKLEQYFGYVETLEMISSVLPDIDPNKIRFEDIETNVNYRKLKEFFEKIVLAYIDTFKHAIDWDEDLIEPEIDFIRFIYDFMYRNIKIVSKIKKGQWENVSWEDRKTIISHIENLYYYGDDTINKYIGKKTSQEIRRFVEDLIFKLENPISYRIRNQAKDITSELFEPHILEEQIRKEPEGEVAQKLMKIEGQLKKILSTIQNIHQKYDENSVKQEQFWFENIDRL